MKQNIYILLIITALQGTILNAMDNANALQFFGEPLPTNGRNIAYENMVRFQAMRGDAVASAHAACAMSDDASAARKKTGAGQAGVVFAINGNVAQSSPVQGLQQRQNNKKYSSITRAIFGKVKKILPTDLFDHVIQGYMDENTLLCEQWAKTLRCLGVMPSRSLSYEGSNVHSLLGMSDGKHLLSKSTRATDNQEMMHLIDLSTVQKTVEEKIALDTRRTLDEEFFDLMENVDYMHEIPVSHTIMHASGEGIVQRDSKTLKKIRTLHTPYAIYGYMTSSPDGKHLVVHFHYNEDGFLLIDLDELKKIDGRHQDLGGFECDQGVCFNASSDDDMEDKYIWDFPVALTADNEYTLSVEEDCAAKHCDDTVVYSSVATLRMKNLKTSKVKTCIRFFKDGVNKSSKISPDHARIAFYGYYSENDAFIATRDIFAKGTSASIGDCQTGKILYKIPHCRYLEWSSDGALLVVNGTDEHGKENTIRLYNAADGSLIKTLIQKDCDVITCPVFAAGGRMIAAIAKVKQHKKEQIASASASASKDSAENFTTVDSIAVWDIGKNSTLTMEQALFAKILEENKIQGKPNNIESLARQHGVTVDALYEAYESFTDIGKKTVCQLYGFTISSTALAGILCNNLKTHCDLFLNTKAEKPNPEKVMETIAMLYDSCNENIALFQEFMKIVREHIKKITEIRGWNWAAERELQRKKNRLVAAIKEGLDKVAKNKSSHHKSLTCSTLYAVS